MLWHFLFVLVGSSERDPAIAELRSFVLLESSEKDPAIEANTLQHSADVHDLSQTFVIGEEH